MHIFWVLYFEIVEGLTLLCDHVGNYIFRCYLIFDNSCLFILITLHTIYPFVKVIPLLRLLNARNDMLCSVNLTFDIIRLVNTFSRYRTTGSASHVKYVGRGCCRQILGGCRQILIWPNEGVWVRRGMWHYGREQKCILDIASKTKMKMGGLILDAS